MASKIPKIIKWHTLYSNLKNIYFTVNGLKLYDNKCKSRTSLYLLHGGEVKCWKLKSRIFKTSNRLKWRMDLRPKHVEDSTYCGSDISTYLRLWATESFIYCSSVIRYSETILRSINMSKPQPQHVKTSILLNLNSSKPQYVNLSRSKSEYIETSKSRASIGRNLNMPNLNNRKDNCTAEQIPIP